MLGLLAFYGLSGGQARETSRWPICFVGLLIGAMVGFLICCSLYYFAPKKTAYFEIEKRELVALPGSSGHFFLIKTKSDLSSYEKFYFKVKGEPMSQVNLPKEPLLEYNGTAYMAKIVKQQKTSFSGLWIPSHLNDKMRESRTVFHVPRESIVNDE
jgi:hypothetical protein